MNFRLVHCQIYIKLFALNGMPNQKDLDAYMHLWIRNVKYFSCHNQLNFCSCKGQTNEMNFICVCCVSKLLNKKNPRWWSDPIGFSLFSQSAEHTARNRWFVCLVWCFIVSYFASNFAAASTHLNMFFLIFLTRKFKRFMYNAILIQANIWPFGNIWFFIQ